MSAQLEAESALTDRYQTTVPEMVRRALRLGKRDRIRYALSSDGAVVLTKVEAQEASDPALLGLLDLLAQDMAQRPEPIATPDAGLLKRMDDLVAGVEVDLSEPLSDVDE
ncbi:MAG: type II toxin-antitoxin system PrlF family antitoxin [Phenylobacterium sp.]|jgi:antitoxin PrlF|nr:type II toxin-antitoxin system PrlF family antitoxin [Phenylobacterium sp.]